MSDLKQQIVRLLTWGVFASIVTGCWSDNHGKHHLIVGIGFGVITHSDTNGVSVSDSAILGAAAGLQQSGIGFLRNREISLDPKLATNVLVQVHFTPGSVSVSNLSINNQ